MMNIRQREFWRCVGEKGKEKKSSFGWVSEGIAEQLNIQQIEFSPTVMWTEIPGWMIQETNVDLEIWKIKRKKKTADLVQELYKYAEEKYEDHIQIYSLQMVPKNSTGATGAAMVVPRYQCLKEHQII